MAVFHYRALAQDDRPIEGSVEAAGRQQAFRMIESRGLTPIRVDGTATEEPRQEPKVRAPKRRKRLPGRVLEEFMRQLASLLSAGVQLSRALQLLTRQASNVSARATWQSIHDMVVDGTALADAMAQFPESFLRVHVAMVRAGETGGFLDAVLDQIAEFQAREKELRSRVLAALVYPCVLACLSILVVLFLLWFFIPRFTVMFEDFGTALPLLTQCIVFASRVLQSYGLLCVALFAAVVWLVRRWLRTETGRRKWEHAVLRLPVVGDLLARFAMTRFCRMLGTLTGSGVTLVNALQVARESLGLQILVDAVSGSTERVRRGESLANSLAEHTMLFPPTVIEMVAVAEQTGELEKELLRVAARTEKDLDRQLKMAVALVEPALLFIMAAVVGTIVVGMVLPMFTLYGSIG